MGIKWVIVAEYLPGVTNFPPLLNLAFLAGRTCGKARDALG